jgi:hypothetical protein
MTLSLGKDVRASLRRLLTAALELPEGGDPVDRLPPNPWGDIEAFRREVYLPLHGEGASSSRDGDVVEVVLAPHEVDLVRDVIDGLAESISGGVPWSRVTESERSAVERLVSQLRT